MATGKINLGYKSGVLTPKLEFEYDASHIELIGNLAILCVSCRYDQGISGNDWVTLYSMNVKPIGTVYDTRVYLNYIRITSNVVQIYPPSGGSITGNIRFVIPFVYK